MKTRTITAAVVAAALGVAGCELAQPDGTCVTPTDDRIIDYTHADVIITCWDDFDGDPQYPTVRPYGVRTVEYPTVTP